MLRRSPMRNRSRQRDSAAEDIAYRLGVFSVALGAVELLAARPLSRGLGLERDVPIVRLCGLREIVTGLGILSSADPRRWIWGRIGGDALDLITLARGLNASNRERGNLLPAIVAVAGVTALDVWCGGRLEAAAAASPIPDYGDRTGFPRPPQEMRGAAGDYEAPHDMRTPEALRPWTDGERELQGQPA